MTRFLHEPLAAGIALLVSACSTLTEPVTTTENAPSPPPAPSAAAAPRPAPPNPNGAEQALAPPTGEMAAASHILVAYKGAMRAAETTTRTKDEAKKRAEQILARAQKGGAFAKLADEASDDPSAKVNHGSLGKFTRERMVKAFSDATFAMKPGEISGLVETPFGYHIIKRTE